MTPEVQLMYMDVAEGFRELPQVTVDTRIIVIDVHEEQRRLKRVQQMSPPVKDRSLVQSWLSLSPRVRLAMSWGMVIIGGTGWVVSDYLEKKIPHPPTNNTAV